MNEFSDARERKKKETEIQHIKTIKIRKIMLPL